MTAAQVSLSILSAPLCHGDAVAASDRPGRRTDMLRRDHHSSSLTPECRGVLPHGQVRRPLAHAGVAMRLRKQGCGVR
jgi:hypothetical protein